VVTRYSSITSRWKDRTMPPRPIRKQISIFVPLADWKSIRLEAARRHIPMTELCRRWMESDLDRLRQSDGDAEDEDFVDEQDDG
jgi:hypothetical protein